MASKTIPLIGIFATLLVAIGVVVVVQKKSVDDNNSDVKNASQKAIENLCQNTHYQQTCVESLTKSTNSSDTRTLIQTSFQVAMKEIDHVIKQLPPMQEASEDPQASSAFELCQKLLHDSIYDLQRTLDRTNSFELDDFWIVLDDINTWLSGALTYQETCLDTLEESEAYASTKARELLEKPKARGSTKVRQLLRPSREITINGFGMANQFSKLMPQRKQAGRNMVRPDAATITHSLLRANPGSVKPHVIVAKDGSGKYRTINEALREVPYRSNDTFVIYIKQGVYQEYVRIESTMWSIMFIGDGPTKTKITGNRSRGGGLETFFTATLYVGGDNFIGKDIGIENTAGGEMHQAAALIVDADKSLFYNCQIDGYQDTLCTHAHRQFYRDCTITGTVDFIFGNGRAVLQNNTIIVRKPLVNQRCMVTAHGRVSSEENTGIVIQSSRIIPAPDYPINDKENYATFLGRPWKPYSRTIVMDSQLDAFIDPMGWTDWNTTANHLSTCWYAEVNNRGPGANLAHRVALPGIQHLSVQEVEEFTPGKLLGDYWIAGLGIPYSSGRIISNTVLRE